MIDRRTLLGTATGLGTAMGLGSVAGLATASAATPAPAEDVTAWPPADHIKLWPGRPPNSPRQLPKPNFTMNGTAPRRELWLRGVAEPVVGVYRSPNPDGRALLVIPGGGYQFVSVQNEGINVALTFVPLGVTVFVLGYRLPGEGWLEPQDVPLQDGQRAMRLIRANAARYGIDPAKLGVIGFSAGGLLTSQLATAWKDPVYQPIDAADRLDAGPAFAGLLYPVTSGDLMRIGALPAGRVNPQHGLVRETPPLFIGYAMDDPVVPFSEPMNMLLAAREAKIPVEAHFFQQGGHGFGPRYLSPDLPGARWPELFDLWSKKALAAPARS